MLARDGERSVAGILLAEYNLPAKAAIVVATDNLLAEVETVVAMDTLLAEVETVAAMDTHLAEPKEHKLTLAVACWLTLSVVWVLLLFAAATKVYHRRRACRPPIEFLPNSSQFARRLRRGEPIKRLKERSDGC